MKLALKYKVFASRTFWSLSAVTSAHPYLTASHLLDTHAEFCQASLNLCWILSPLACDYELYTDNLLFGFLFYSEYGDIFLRNVGLSPNYRALQPRTPYS
jgi:hypothetical protein